MSQGTGGETEVGGPGCSSGPEELPVNGLTDNDHISFSYSSDEDFLPQHMTTPTPDNKKPHHDIKEEGKPCNGWLTSDLDSERERRKSESLSLDERRRRLCSITPRVSLATPTLTTPSSSTGDNEFPRQPVSPGIKSPAHKMSQNSSPSEFEPCHSPVPENKKSRSPMPQSTGQRSDEEWSSEQSGNESWLPSGVGVARRKKNKKHHSRTTRDGESGKSGKMGRGGRGRGRETESEKVLEEDPERESSDDENQRVLEELKRKVREDKDTELQMMTSYDVTDRNRDEERVNDKGKSLADELAMSSSSSDSEMESQQEVTKTRPKRQLLSSDSDSDAPPPRHTHSQPGKPTGHSSVRERPTTPPVYRRKEESHPTEGSPAAKKLRLVDIDFTGGRMRLAPPKPAQSRPSPGKPRPHPSLSKSHPLQSERSGHGHPHKRLSKVSAGASNVLKVKPLPRPHPPIRRPAESKDLVLAAKFPQKRVLDTTPPNKAHHKSSKLKHTFRQL